MSYSQSSGTARSRPLICLAAMVVGAVFILVGVLGFIPGITTNFGDMTFVGQESDAKLLGLFQVSVVHNLVHLLYGVAGILAAKAAATSRTYLIGGGIIYLVLWIYGLVTSDESSANFVPLNNADDWLHLGLGIGMIGLGVALSRDTSSRTATV